MKSGKVLILILLLSVIYSLPVLAEVEMGGEVKSNISTTVDNGEVETYLQNYLNLELFLPTNGNTEANFAVDFLNTSSLSNNITPYVKKLYLEYHASNFDLSIGRQPISWSFGSLLNPVDFTLGAEAMDEETAAKNVDALNIYYPINWNSSITGVVGIPNNGDIKTGIRARTYFKGYDLSLNYVQDREEVTNDINRRVGISGKGDLGPISTYGAVNYYLDQEEAVYLVGADYSFYINDVNKVTLQLEYLYDQADFSERVIEQMLTVTNNNQIKIGQNLVTALASYKIDDFSSLNSYAIVIPDNEAITILGGEYQNQLGSNLDLILSSSCILSDEDSSGMLGMSFSYLF